MEKHSMTKAVARHPVLIGVMLGLAACAPTSWTDPQPGRAAAPPPPDKLSQAAPIRPSPVVVWDSRTRDLARNGADSGFADTQAPQQRVTDPRPGPQSDQQPPPRRRGSSSPPPVAAPMPVPSPLPQAPSTDAMTDRFKRDLMSPQVDRMRTDDALGNLNPLQQRELFDKQRDLGRIGGPLGN